MNYFLLGLIFMLFVQPIIDSLSSVVISFFEMLKSYFAVIIAQNNKKINEPPSRTIGFSISEEDNNDL